MINRIKRSFRILGMVAMGTVLTLCTPRFYPVNPGVSIRDDVSYLASAALEGRKPGTRGDTLAARYIRDRFAASGADLLFENGLQSFSLISSAVLGENNDFKYNGTSFTLSQGYLPYSFSSENPFSGEVVFGGYGFDIESDTLTWNDYAGLDVKGRWVLLLKGDPEIDKAESRFGPYSEERAKVLTALDRGAAGVIFTGGPAYSETDQLQELFFDKNSSTYPIPVFQITRGVADTLLASSGVTVATLEKKLNTTMQPAGFNAEREGIGPG